MISKHIFNYENVKSLNFTNMRSLFARRIVTYQKFKRDKVIVKHVIYKKCLIRRNVHYHYVYVLERIVKTTYICDGLNIFRRHF
jgi:hypothetical protein